MSGVNALPILTTPPLESATSKCTGDHCPTCVLADVCVQSHGACTHSQAQCNMDCNDCGGGTHQFQFQGTNSCPAICCRSPLSKTYIDMVKKDRYHFKKRPLIHFNQKQIVMHHGLFGGADTDLFPSGTEVVGVNLKNVWTRRGWHSRDMRDYLRVPANAKLILFSCTYDSVLEFAWEHDVHNTDFSALGFDYWEIYELSRYGDYSNMFNNWMGYRALYAGEASQAHFCQPMPWSIDASKAEAKRPWVEWAERVPQMTVNWQFIPLKNAVAWKWYVASMRRVLSHLPGIKSLWFQGVASGPQVFNLKLAFPEYDCYFISSSPWMRAQQRKQFTETGGYASSDRERLDLLLQNQLNYATLVSTALAAAAQKLAGASSSMTPTKRRK